LPDHGKEDVMDQRPVALVTGGSRGIGKAIAVHLARAGYDVAFTARTVAEGEAREHSSTAAHSDSSPLPGSLSATSVEVEAAGGRAMPLVADFTDRVTLGTAVERVLCRWGGIDVLVNNARYVGPGHMDRFLDTPLDALERTMEVNFFAPVILTRLVLPHMLARGRGDIVNISTGVEKFRPTRLPGQGGVGIAYIATKSAFHHIAPYVQLEHGSDGIRAFNIHPGLVATERNTLDMGAFGYQMERGAPPDAIGAVVAWLVTDAEGSAYTTRTVMAQELCAERGLLPGWSGPQPMFD
jgi:NAD(P)-dependent dehydrogenase (short-subunit alcohol dehydrogenase family)